MIILTVVDFYEINAVYPRIIQDPGNDENTLWYKDYDIDYTNQNSVLGSFVCMGSHFAGFIEEDDDKCWVYYDASNTYSLVGGTLSYFWNFSSGTVVSTSGTNSVTPGWVYYQTPGHYTTELTVSGSVGGVDKSYRHVSIYKRPGEGINIPLLNWELLDLNGDRESGGYTATIRLLQNVPEVTIRDGALVVIFADDWYNGEYVSIGGNQVTREKIVFSGYILNGSIRYNYQYSAVEFDVGSPTAIMQQSECFAVSITDSPNDPITDYNAHRDTYPSPWVLVEDLGVSRGIYHYLKWHSTVMNCCDIRYYTDDRAIFAQDFDRASLYDSVNTLIQGALLGRCVSDRQGTIWFERDIYVTPDAYSTGTSYYLTKRDWMNEPQIEERQTDETSYIEIGGVSYTQSIEESVPLLAAIPGTAPGYRGGVERIQGLALLDQAELNSIGGYLYKYKNVRYPDVSINLAGNYRNADIAPQEKWHLLVEREDTVRQLSVDINCFIKGTSFVYNPEEETFLTSVSLAEISTSLIGDTLIIPQDPPEPNPVPDPHPNPWPSPSTGTASPTGTVSYYGIAYVAGNGGTSGTAGLFYCANFSPATGTVQIWQHAVLDTNIAAMFVDETSPTYVYYISNSNVFRYTQGGSAELVLTAAQAFALAGVVEYYGLYNSIWVDKSNGDVYICVKTNYNSFRVLRSQDHGTTWLAAGNPGYVYIGSGGGISARGSYIWFGHNNGIVCSSNGGSTWIYGGGPGYNIQIDPVTPSICWGTQEYSSHLYKHTYSGGAITTQDITTSGSNQHIRHLWMNPSNSNHQRRFNGVAVSETFNQWASSIQYNNVIPYNSLAICQQRWSIDYNWEASLTDNIAVYAAPTISGSYTMHNGSNPLIPPYTDSIPFGQMSNTVNFGFWAGKST